jgi:hypothetical protein
MDNGCCCTAIMIFRMKLYGDVAGAAAWLLMKLKHGACVIDPIVPIGEEK